VLPLGPASASPTARNTPRGYSGCMSTLTYTVPAMHCGNCTAAVEREISQIPGVDLVEAELSTKQVVVRGEGIDDAAVREAIKEAGYEAA
jgi:copper chaperone